MFKPTWIELPGLSSWPNELSDARDPATGNVQVVRKLRATPRIIKALASSHAERGLRRGRVSMKAPDQAASGADRLRIPELTRRPAQ